MRLLLTLSLFSLISLKSIAQDFDPLENNLDLQSGTESVETDNWNYLEYPKDINKITEDELEHLTILSKEQIQSFIRYRKYVWKIYSIYELLDIPSFNIHTFHKIAPFIHASFKPSNNTRDYFIFQTNRFLNVKHTPFNTFQRNQYQLRVKKSVTQNIGFGLSLDSDIGEQFHFRKQVLTNHAVGYIELKKVLHLDKIIIGTFNNHYGQGLMFSNQFFNGKSSRSIYNSYFNSDATAAYKSMGESGYLKGISIYKKVKKVKFYAWASSIKLSGTVSENKLTSIYNTGYFRVNKESLKRNIIQEDAIGGRVSFKLLHNSLKFSFSGAQFNYTAPLQLNYMTTPTNRFLNLGTDYLIRTKFVSLFGEVVKQNNYYIHLHGLQSNIDDNTQFSIIYRNYHPLYFNPRANGFSSFSNNRNEEGLYLSVNHKLNRTVAFFGYIDRYNHITASYGTDLPSQNTSWILGTHFLLKHQQRITIAYKQDKVGLETIENKLIQATHKRFKHIFITHKVQSKEIQITTNLQVKSASGNESINFGQYLKNKYKEISYTLGYNIFSTTASGITLYQYQPDLTFNNSFNPLSGEGSQFYSILSININKRLVGSTKVLLTLYSDKDEITKGLETIEDNKVWEAKFQLFYKL